MPAQPGARSARTGVQPRSAVPSGTVTFLFTDIEGSTRLLERLRGRYADLMAEHRRILRAVFAEWRGHEVETQGDSFFVAFSRASDAVGAAVAGQRALASAEWPDGVEVRVRMGIHTGEPLLAGPDYVGIDVHRAARVAAVGHGGQILLSGTTHDLVVDELATDVTLTDLGSYRLKDIRRETRLYQVAGEGLRADFGPLVTPSAEESPPTPGESPYRGLQAFEESDADLFFGREAIVDELAERLNEARFLALIGASGSGKSSILRAGLMPRLRRHGDGARVLLLTPTAHPIEELAATLEPDAPAARLAELAAMLRADPRALALERRRSTGRDKATRRRTVIAVDQLEELFTLCRDEGEREAFLASVAHASGLDDSAADSVPEADGATLLITLRADFYASLAPYDEIRAAAATSQVYVGAMHQAELQRAIEEPARRGGWKFVPGLVELLLRDVGDEPGALPLLSHALLETWQRRRGTTMTLRSYDESGGVKGAIAKTADRVYETELSESQRRIARDLFVRLTELGEGAQDTRRRARTDELMPSSGSRAREVRSVIQKLADARLVTVAEDTIEVAHEALIREWPTLREWLNTDRESLRAHRRLTEAALEWEVSGADESLLFRGARLAQARELTAFKGVLNPLEQRFLDAAVALEEAEAAGREASRQRELDAAQALAATESRRAEEEARAARGLRRRALLLAGALAVAGVLAAAAFVLAQQSDANASLAAQRAQEASQNADLAEQRENEARHNADLADAAAQDARDLATQARVQRLAADATQILVNGREPELAALLALAALDTQYNAQADAVLQRAGRQVTGQRFVHDGEVIAAAVTPDGNTLITASNAVVRIWDVETATELGQLPIPLEPTSDETYWQLALSDDGATLMAWPYFGRAAMWRLNPEQPGASEQIADGCAALDLGIHEMSGDGQVVVSYVDSVLLAWRVDQCERLGPAIEAVELNDPAVSADGALVAATIFDASVLAVWDLNTGEKVFDAVRWPGAFWHPSFSRDSSTLSVGMFDGTALAFDLESGEVLATFRGHSDAVERAILSGDGSILLTSSLDGTARLWDAQDATELRRFVHPSPVRQSILTRDGRTVFTAAEDGLAREWSAAGEELAFLAGAGEVASLSFSADGTRLASAAGDQVRVFELSSRTFTADISMPRARLVSLSPAGDLLLAVSAFETVLLDAKNGQPVRLLASASQPRVEAATAGSFSGDGSLVLTPLPGADASVILYETATGQIRQAFDMEVATLSSDGTRVAGWNPGRYSIFDATSGAGIAPIGLGQIDGRRVDVQLTPDGTRIVSGDHDNVVRVRDIATQAIVHELRGHIAAIRQVRVSADGRYVLTSGDDGGARLWSLETGDQLRYFAGHDGVTITSIAISADGHEVALGSADGAVIVTPTSIDELAQNVCARLSRDLTAEERTAYGIEATESPCP
ncbi:MAG: adenylate/guanylate cyclase domain-containing protein [Chloroflexota bacterium]